MRLVTDKNYNFQPEIKLFTFLKKIFNKNSYLLENKKSWNVLKILSDNNSEKFERISKDFNLQTKILKNEELSFDLLNEILIHLNLTYEHEYSDPLDIYAFELTSFSGINACVYIGYLDFLAGLPTKIWSSIFYDKNLQIMELLACFKYIISNSSKISYHGYLELLSKYIIYREPKLGLIVPGIGYWSKKLEHYVVEDCFASGYGCTYIILRCVTNKEPFIVVFSGSNFHPAGLDTISSIISDSEYCLGKEAFKSVELKFDLFFNRINKNDVVNITGHSLGGNLAQHLTVYKPNRVNELVTFSSPGIDKIIAEEYVQKLKRYNNKPKITIYITDKDIVSYAGEHLGLIELGNTSIVKYKIKQTIYEFMESPFRYFVRPHTYPCISNPRNFDMSYQNIIKYEDKRNILSSRNHENIENIRKYVGGYIIAPFLKFLRPKIRTIFKSRSSKNN